MQHPKLLINILTFLSIALILYLFNPFLSHIAIASVLAVATNDLHKILLKVDMPFGYLTKKALVSFALSVLLLSFIFTPFVYFLSYLFDFLAQFDKKEMTEYIQHSYEYIKNRAEDAAFLKPYFEMAKNSIDSIEIGKNIAQNLINKTIALIKGIGNISYDIALIMVFYFLINLYGRRIFFYISERVALDIHDKKLIISRFFATVASTFYAAVFNIFAQGIAFYILIVALGGNHDALFFGLTAGFLSVIPFVGNALVYIPLAAYEIFHQHYVSAVIIVLYSIFVLGFVIDNVLRAVFIGFISKIFRYKYRLNELLLILSMASGISVLGFWGVIYGPALLAICMAIFDIQRGKNI